MNQGTVKHQHKYDGCCKYHDICVWDDDNTKCSVRDGRVKQKSPCSKCVTINEILAGGYDLDNHDFLVDNGFISSKWCHIQREFNRVLTVEEINDDKTITILVNNDGLTPSMIADEASLIFSEHFTLDDIENTRVIAVDSFEWSVLVTQHMSKCGAKPTFSIEKVHVYSGNKVATLLLDNYPVFQLTESWKDNRDSMTRRREWEKIENKKPLPGSGMNEWDTLLTVVLFFPLGLLAKGSQESKALKHRSKTLRQKTKVFHALRNVLKTRCPNAKLGV